MIAAFTRFACFFRVCWMSEGLSETFVSSCSDTDSLIQTDGSPAARQHLGDMEERTGRTLSGAMSVSSQVPHLDYCRLSIPDCNDTSFHSLTVVKQAAASCLPAFADVIRRPKI